MKILAVDDDGIALGLLQQCLNQGGYTCSSFMSTPTNVVETLENTSIPYDCILLDIEMPEMNGIDLCSSIRQLNDYQSTPVLMISQRSDIDAIRQAFAKGATDYITKPFNFFEVLARIRIAEKLVQERQAAIESYKFEKLHDFQSNEIHIIKNTLAKNGKEYLAADGAWRERLISLNNLNNFLDQATKNNGCTIGLVAVKIYRIEEIFAKTTAAEFLQFIDLVANSVLEEFEEDETFISHTGQGTFIVTTQHAEAIGTSLTEWNLAQRVGKEQFPALKKIDFDFELQIGTPLILNTTPTLNFRRAIKATIARLENLGK